MLKQLFSVLKSGDSLDRAFAEFEEMLGHAQWMFIRANEVINRGVEAESVRDAIYERDRSINDLLKGIRRKIVRHLTINAGSDVAASLALMSVAKDAERIGDYCKNVFEVGRFYEDDFGVPAYHNPLEEIRVDVESLFGSVRDAWHDSEPKKAKQSIKKADEIRARCDEIISRLLGDRASIETHEAVAYSLLARHYKRVASHLANISTGVLGTIEDLDFRKP